MKRKNLLRKTTGLLLALSLLLSSAYTVMANDDIKVTIDGRQIAFDVPPQLINDRTMVPLRAIFENLGATVNWDADTQTVTSTKENITINLTIDNPIMYVNGKAVTLDSPGCLVDGRTLVPVRAISEAFGTTVDWNADDRTVSVITKEIPIEKLTFDTSDDTVTVGENKDLSVSVYPQNATTIKALKWKSSNTSVVTVNNGKILGIAEGIVTVICESSEGIKAECTITVTPAPIKATSVGINLNGQYIAPNGTIELSVGDKLKLNAKTLPENANTNTDVTWEFTGSSNYMTLSADGELVGNDVINNGKIRAKLPDGTSTEFKVVIKKATIKIELRDSLPKKLYEYDYRDNIRTSVKITDFEYDVTDYTYSEDQTVYLYFSGEKSYDAEGSKHSSACEIGWKLYDEDGYVIESGTCRSSGVAEGEKFRKAKDYIFDVLPGRYYLELINTK